MRKLVIETSLASGATATVAGCDRRKRSPDIKEQDVILHARLPRPQGLGSCRVPSHLKSAEFLAQQMGVQQGREFSIGLVSSGCRRKNRKRMTEVQQQAQSIELGQP